jgi:hypothetical protein
MGSGVRYLCWYSKCELVLSFSFPKGLDPVVFFLSRSALNPLRLKGYLVLDGTEHLVRWFVS